MNCAWRLVGLLFVLWLSGPAQADVFRPAYLELRELSAEEYQLTWKVPAQSAESRLAIRPVLPSLAQRTGEPRTTFYDNAWTEQSIIRVPGGLAGQTIGVEGRALGASDIIVRIERRDGSSQVERLSAANTTIEVTPAGGRLEVAWSYLVLGVEHILGGIDHLLFVLALLLIVQGAGRIVATITAFTVAHSLTLIAATLGWVRMPGPPVEAIIALSIVFVAAEVVHGARGKPGLTAQAPWVVAFSFGLLHGLGFAGALAEVGLPQVAIPIALLTFNLGVELGQLIFVFAVLLLGKLVHKLGMQRYDWMPQAMAYAIGSVAAFWTLERVAGFV